MMSKRLKTTRAPGRWITAAIISCLSLFFLFSVSRLTSIGKEGVGLSDPEIERRLTVNMELTKEDWSFADNLKELEDRLSGKEALLKREREKLEREHSKMVEKILGGMSREDATEQYLEVFRHLTTVKAFLERHPDFKQRYKEHGQEAVNRELKNLKPEERTLSDADFDKYLPVWIEFVELGIERKNREEIILRRYGSDKQRLQMETEKVADEYHEKTTRFFQEKGITRQEFDRAVLLIFRDLPRLDRYLTAHPDLRRRYEAAKRTAGDMESLFFAK